MKVVHDDGRYVLVGSFNGAEEEPLWVGNILTNPTIRLQDRAQVVTVVACPVAEEERAAVWASALRWYPLYEEYQSRTLRQIPLFLCDPVTDA